MTVAEASGPFVGLRPFEGRDHHLFFGRETHVDRLLLRLRDQRFLAVVGISGSGKSSLVRAGLLPRLERSFTVGGRCCWRFAMLRPGSDPVGALAAALRDASPEADPEWAGADPEPPDDAPSGAPQRLERDQREGVAVAERRVVEFVRGSLLRSSLALVDYVRAMDLDDDENLLIVVDQFEELFRYRALVAERDQDRTAHFISLLLEAAARSDMPVFVVVTMRSDFLGDCARFPMLAEAINRGQYLVSFLTRRHREEAIVKPLRAFDLLIEPKLLHRLHDDTRSRDDQLPVLQHALMRTHRLWSARAGRQEGADTITHSDYEAAGGMAKAMSDHANEAMQEIEAEDLRTVQLLFRALTERREDGRAVRRPCRVSEIMEVSGAPLARIEAIVRAFQERDQRHFIVVRPRGPLTPESELDLAHESLMRVWDLYAKWTKREVADAGQLRRLQELKERYDKGEAGLLRDPELGVVLNWVGKAQPSEVWARRYSVVWAPIRQFIAESRSAERARRLAAIARADAERRALRNKFYIAAVAVVVVLAVLVWAVLNKLAVVDLEEEKKRLAAERDVAATERDEAEEDKKKANAMKDELETQVGALRRDKEEVSRELEEHAALIALVSKLGNEHRKVDLEAADILRRNAEDHATTKSAEAAAAVTAATKADVARKAAIQAMTDVQKQADGIALQAEADAAAIEWEAREAAQILRLMKKKTEDELREVREFEDWRGRFDRGPQPGDEQ